MPPVKSWALARGIELWQPRNINNLDSIAKLREVSPDLMIVVAYGKILSKEVLSIPPLGSINVHASLLPDLRGAAPIEWAIIHGYTETGITTMFMDEGLDTGDIIMQLSTEIGPSENGAQLRERLAVMAQALLPITVGLVLRGEAVRSPQPQDCPNYAPVLDSSMERIDWTQSALGISNYIRALSPKPGCYSIFREKRLKILMAVATQGSASPGTILLPGKTLLVGTGDGLLELVDVQPEGKKPIKAQELVNGYRIQEGEQFQ